VKLPVSLTVPHTSIIDCPVAGFGTVRASLAQIAILRGNPMPAACPPLSLPLLKHADDQTVAGLAAVFQAIHQHGLGETDFSEWGVVAASSYLGRAALAATLQRMAAEGAWGISPHFIPHHSLHATSGTISQVLKTHGPNFGIEATPGGMALAITVAATLLTGGDLPGLWLVLTEHQTEWIPPDPDLPREENQTHAPDCVALALALVPGNFSPVIQLRVCPQSDSESSPVPAAWTSWKPLERLSALADALGHGLPSRHWRLGSHGWVELLEPDFGAEGGL
jgi:hypothetical protein